jgi:hypothetical protein
LPGGELRFYDGRRPIAVLLSGGKLKGRGNPAVLKEIFEKELK